MAIKIQLDRNKVVDAAAKDKDKVNKKDLEDRLAAIEARLDKLEKKAGKA